jgi:Phytochelatin synthase
VLLLAFTADAQHIRARCKLHVPLQQCTWCSRNPAPLTWRPSPQDTARFKYPPHWVPLPELYAAMFDRVDPVSAL